MKILHINSYYSTSTFYKNLFDKQIESGLNIDVFVPVSSSYKLSTETNYGKYTRINKNHGKYDRFLFHLKHNKIYNDIVNQYNIKDFSIIHAHSLFSNGYIAYKLKEKFGVPYVVAVRNTDVNIFLKYMFHLRRLGIKVLLNADHVVFISKSYRDDVVKKYIPDKYKEKILNKTSVIQNGIDDFWLNNRNIKKIKPQKEVKLLYVGAINRNKNITTTVKAVKKLKNEEIDVKLTVVGRIEDQNIFDNIKSLDYVEYIEPKPKEELIKIYQQNEIFVMPSIHETFGLVYAEAMSQGLPVIYTRGQGFDGQFKDGDIGFSVNHNDANEIAERIKDILNDYQTISENCIKQLEKYSWENINNKYIKLYSFSVR